MKTKCYRYNSPAEFYQLIEKFGEKKFNYIPDARYVDSGYLYDQETYNADTLGGYTSASRETFHNPHGAYKNCVEVTFEEAMKPETLEEQIKDAQKYVGNKNWFYTNMGGQVVKALCVPKHVKIAYKGESSIIAEEYMKKNGLDFCVVLSGETSSIPFGLVTEPPKSKDVVLNDQYTAEVHKDYVQVGCQRIPIEKVKEILKANEEL
jgi:hypothetical protein